MEWQFFINWSAIVEEAKQRRKGQRLTQSRLAKMAGVSTPTISRFESGEKDIQLSTVMRILAVLGMHDKRNLVFREQNARYSPGQMAVVFSGRDGDKIISCAISGEVLVDYFNGDEKNLLKVFQANHEQIEHEVRRKYLAGNFEADGVILLKASDMG